MDSLSHLGCTYGTRGDKTNMLFYSRNQLPEMWSPHGRDSRTMTGTLAADFVQVK